MNAVIIGIIAFLYIVTSLWVGITGYVRTVEATHKPKREILGEALACGIFWLPLVCYFWIVNPSRKT